MRDTTPFDIKAVKAIIARGLNCKRQSKGEAMILDELLQQWPGDRRAFTTVDESRKYAERRLKSNGRPGNDRRDGEDRRDR